MKWIDPKDCSGCGTCQAVCARNAIEMVVAENGFKYPEIRAELCTDCGRCMKICLERQQESRKHPVLSYAAVGRNEEIVNRSASGGVFAVLAHSFAQNGGRVTGAVMQMKDGGLHVYHKLSEDANDISAMQGSKYVQSDAWDCYKDIIAAIRQGERVLFSGTPCQVSAVKRLTGDPENLVTIDLVCHGVPSARMFNEFSDILSRRFVGKLEEILFRDKSCGRNYCARLSIGRRSGWRTFYLNSSLLSFYRLFLDAVIFRESCYDCPYASLERVADVTIGDYWGVEEKHAADFASGAMEKRSDWSCVLVNTDKGRRLIEDCQDGLKLTASRPEWIAEKNAQLNHSSCRPEEREALLKLYAKGGYRAVERAFIQTHGGTVRYYWRIAKNIHANRKRCMRNKEKK